jgi:hypothetical protein
MKSRGTNLCKEAGESWPGAGTGRGAATGDGTLDKAAPQSLQNFEPAGLACWQLGQRTGKRAPHSLQNFAESGFSW